MPTLSTSSSDEAPKPAFPLPEAAQFPDDPGPPTTAEQYLHQVRREASNLPSVFVAEHSAQSPPPPPKKRRQQTSNSLLRRIRLAHTPHFATPDQQWARDLVFQFANLQQMLVRAQIHPPPLPAHTPVVPNIGQTHAWRTLLLADGAPPPTVSFVARVDHVRAREALGVLDDELQSALFVDEQGAIQRKDVQSAALLADAFLHQRRAQWLFALLALILPPLSGETAAVIRSLLRKASIARLGLDGAEDERLPALNVLITILSDHFGQGDAT